MHRLMTIALIALGFSAGFWTRNLLIEPSFEQKLAVAEAACRDKGSLDEVEDCKSAATWKTLFDQNNPSRSWTRRVAGYFD